MLLRDEAGTASPDLDHIIEQQIVQRTSGRIHRLRVEIEDGRVLVRGCTGSHHVKQLALLAVMDCMDATHVELDVEVMP
jgi:hypothetical protein